MMTSLFETYPVLTTCLWAFVVLALVYAIAVALDYLAR